MGHIRADCFFSCWSGIVISLLPVERRVGILGAGIGVRRLWPGLAGESDLVSGRAMFMRRPDACRSNLPGILGRYEERGWTLILAVPGTLRGMLEASLLTHHASRAKLDINISLIMPSCSTSLYF